MSARIAVVVPVHDEQDLLPDCLRALARAARTVRTPVELVIVFDACTDASAVTEIDRDAFAVVRTIAVQHRNVGSARGAGFQAVTRQPGLWLATTDADSCVPPDWFVRQLRHGERGSEVVIGTVVVPDWTERPEDVRQRYVAAYRPGDGHRHVHGANLSFSAESYDAVGGFSPLPTDEDVHLVAAFARGNYRLTWAGDLAVATSARLTGRAPSGFAAHLSGLSRATPAAVG